MSESRNAVLDEAQISLHEAQTLKVMREIEALEQEAQVRAVKLQLDQAQLTQAERFIAIDKAKAEENRIYTFYGAVSSGSVGPALKALGEWHRRAPHEPIEIIFNSPGGSVLDGLALYDYIHELRHRGTPINTVTMGMAASMGGILLQAGEKRIASKNALILIHEVSMGAGGKMSEIEDELAFGKKLQQKCLDILAERSTMTARQINTKWQKKDWWLDANEALKLGFVDEVR